MQSSSRIARRALPFLAVVACVQPSARADVVAGASAFNDSQQDSGGLLTFSASAQAFDSFSTPGFDGPGSTNTLSASSAARAIHGGVRAIAMAHSSGSHSFASISSTAGAMFSDIVTISTPLPITVGTFSALIWISGSISFDAPGFAFASASASVQSSLGSDAASVDLNEFNPFTSGYHQIQIPFVLGEPFTISGNALVGATASSNFNEGGSTVLADMSGTINWGGITEVHDASGNLITDWSVASESGADYRDEIIPPEIPAPGASALLALALTGAPRHRRAPRHAH